MTNRDLEVQVSRALQRMYPEPTDVRLGLPSESSRPARRGLAIAGSAAAVLAIGAGVGAFQAVSSSSDRAASSSTGWVDKCMPHKAADRHGAAPEYVGLTWHAAGQLASQRGDTLKFVGGGGKCYMDSQFDLDAHVVAIALDKEVSVGSGIPSSDKVIAAERVSSYWYVGS